jgi:hypothetical protein
VSPDNGKFALKCQFGDHHSKDSLVTDKGILFHWSDNDNVIFCEIDGTAVTIKCYLYAAKKKFNADCLKGMQPIWSQPGTKYK